MSRRQPHSLHRRLALVVSLLVWGGLVPVAPVSAQQVNDETVLRIENELLLDVRLDGEPLGAAILGYRRGDEVLLALSELMDVLQFPVNVDADAGRAGGWFVEEARSFSLNRATGEVSAGDRNFSLADAEAIPFQGDLYVPTSSLERWFPITLAPQIRQLSLDVSTRETIPLQERMARSSTRRVGGVGGLSREAQLPFQPTPYRFLGPHATDIRLNLSSVLEDEDDTSTSLGGNYSILSRGDLLWMTSTIAVSGNKDDDVSDGRFQLERSDLDGPLALEHVEVGDVDVGNARGLLIRGGGAQEGMSGLFADEQVDLRGDIPPDWEVELYRNGVLIDFQVVGGDAQYEFLNVPLEFGENRFEFVFYGPFGENRREEQVFYAGRSGLELGDVSYELAAVQDGRTVFDVRSPSARGDVDSARYLGDVNIGLASNAVATLGVDSFVVDDERHEDYSAGLSINFATLQTSLGYQDRALEQDEATGLLRGRVGRQTTGSLRYTHYLKGDLDADQLPSDRQRWSATGSLATRAASLPINLDAFHLERQRSSASAASIGTTHSTETGWRLSKSFFYEREELVDDTDQRTGGAFNVSTSLRPWRFRAGVGYNLSPDTEISTVNSSATLRVDSRMTMNLDITHSALTDYTTYRTGFNWLLDVVQISPQIVYDSNERWTGLVSVSTSLNPRPGHAWPEFSRLSQTGYGAAYARAFLDANGNGVLDPDEAPLQGAQIDAVQAWQTAQTDAEGRAYLHRLRPDRLTDIAMVSSSLADIELNPSTPGVSIEPRPGSWSQVDFPVIRTLELEGHVYGQGGRDDRIPLERVVVQLLDAEGQVRASQRTAFDGFFLFAAIPPGQYQLRLGDAWRDRVVDRPGPINARSSGGVLRDQDFLLAAEGRQLVEFGELEPSTPAAPESVPEAEAGPSRQPPSPGFAPPVEDADEPAVLMDVPVTDPEPLRNEAARAGARPAGDWFVQLGAFGERGNAERYWRRLREDGVLPASAEARYQEAGRLVRLLAGPGQPESAARGLCQRLKSDGADCLVREMTGQ
ncbi:SPOR domain-containing protein [Marinobacter xestospongiae]|uniref:SPOR domain-containing protein n=1 Tax=Marinobacter xestospongiae TaxID=994319 RepID=A0ABU3W1F2_9GAMM|nr:SPOR domain-containing protein [Marinobacter xestospongiae]MDV2080334.1 SPOR domain-containing protein [Marinobacter xestospongiae]